MRAKRIRAKWPGARWPKGKTSYGWYCQGRNDLWSHPYTGNTAPAEITGQGVAWYGTFAKFGKIWMSFWARTSIVMYEVYCIKNIKIAVYKSYLTLWCKTHGNWSWLQIFIWQGRLQTNFKMITQIFQTISFLIIW